MKEIFIYVPQSKIIIKIEEGTGVNLFEEDIENGYEDYIMFYEYDLENDFKEEDGGELLLRQSPDTLEETIPNVLEFLYGDKTVPYTLLK